MLLAFNIHFLFILLFPPSFTIPFPLSLPPFSFNLFSFISFLFLLIFSLFFLSFSSLAFYIFHFLSRSLFFFYITRFQFSLSYFILTEMRNMKIEVAEAGERRGRKRLVICKSDFFYCGQSSKFVMLEFLMHLLLIGFFCWIFILYRPSLSAYIYIFNLLLLLLLFGLLI